MHGLSAVLLAVLLGLILGLNLIAAGSRLGGGLAIEGVDLRDCIGGDQAHNRDAPGQPPPRLLEAELRKDSDHGDPRCEPANVGHEPHDPAEASSLWLALGERRSAAAQRAREGHGPRGPPRA